MISTTPSLRGHVKVWNEAGESFETHNLVVFGAGDIIAALLSGNQAYKLAYMYFVYENTAGAISGFTPARTDTVSLFHSMAAPRDFIRAPVLSPTFAASDVNHVANRATFMAVTNASTGVLTRPFGAANDSKIFSLGLVAAPTGSYTGDVLYAHFALSTPIAAVGSGQISASWTVEAL